MPFRKLPPMSPVQFRLLARYVDFLLGMVVTHLIFPPWSPVGNSYLMRRSAEIFVGALVIVLLDVIFLPVCGASPGKLIMGLQVRQADGARLTPRGALVRTLHLWLRGFALGIPVVAWYTALSSYIRFRDHGTTAWDQAAASGVIHLRVSKWRTMTAYLVLAGMLAGISYLDDRTPPVNWRVVSGPGFSASIPYFESDPRNRLTVADLPGGAGTMYWQSLHAHNYFGESLLLHQFSPRPDDAAKEPRALLKEIQGRAVPNAQYKDEQAGAFGPYPMLEYTAPGYGERLHRLIRTPKYVYILEGPADFPGTRPFFDSLTITE